MTVLMCKNLSEFCKFTFLKINLDLEDNWMVVAEGIQTILRREGYEKPYEKLKDFRNLYLLLDKNVSL